VGADEIMGRPKANPPLCHPDRPHMAHGLCNYCYHQKYRAERRSRDPEFEKYMGWEKHLKKKYNLTLDQFWSMLEAQGGHCKLCGMKPDDMYKKFCVDHDHKTGRIRGILCKFCNSKLGWFENRREGIEEYLK